MVTLLLTVACACAPDESGKHPVELSVEEGERVIVRRMASPCPYKEADAIDRLGVPTCVSVIDALRRALSGKSFFTLARSDVTDETEALWGRAKTDADKLRETRRKAALQNSSERQINILLTARLSRLWPADVTGVAAVHFGLSNPPQVRIFFSQTKMALFVFEKTRREGWRWRLREGARPADVQTLVPNLERAINGVLPENAMRGACVLAKKEKVQIW